MVDDLLDLQKVLRWRTEQLTLQEATVIRTSKARWMSYFYIGFGGGSAVTWLATQGLHILLRGSFILPTGIVCGSWLARRSLESSVEHILSLEGSRIQREMANIMLKRHHDDPWVRRIVSKHFYPEEVYVESSADKPTFRWRHRNFSGESVTHSQNTTSYGAEETNPKEKKIENTRKPEPGQQVSATAGADAGTEDPFDVVLGVSESAADDGPKPRNEASRKQTRKEKRSRRRQWRQHRHEESDDE